MKTEGTPLHGSYFDLATAKHPDLQSPERSQQQEHRAPRRRWRFGVLPAVLCGALVGVVWLVIALRPEGNVRLVASTAPAPASLSPEAVHPEGLEVQSSAVFPDPGSPEVASEGAPRSPDPPSVIAGTIASPESDGAASLPTTERTESFPETPRPVVPTPVVEDNSVEEPISVAEDSERRATTAPESPVAEATRQDSAIIADSTEIPEAQPEAAPEPLEIPREPSIVGESTPIDAEPTEFLPARKIFSPPPEYPDAARLAGEEGTVVVEANIDPSGVVTDAVVVRGRSPALDAAAIAALEAWRFDPATRGGTAIASSYRVGFTFAFNEESEAPPDEASEPEPTGPFEVGGDVTAPRRLEAPLPAYPDAAWAQGVAGDVLVRAVIDENGDVTQIEVLRGLPYGLTEAAVEAIKRWKFAPSTRNGKPVAVYRNLNLRFEG